MSATLASIRIKNFALVGDITWEPGGGFNAVSGETGAGKSILIGALLLLLGERADRSLIRSGEKETVIEAAFDQVDSTEISNLLEEAGAEPCEENTLLIKRVVNAAGGGKQFVNGSACTISLLRSLGELLVDLHGPHDHQSLFSRDQQTRLLDEFSGSATKAKEFRELRKCWLALVEEKETLEQEGQSLAREVDLLRHQIAEIESAEIHDGEEEELLAAHNAAANAEKIQELCAQALGCFGEGTGGLSDGLVELGRIFRELERLDISTEKFASRQLEILEMCSDLERELGTYADRIEGRSAELRDLEERLDLLGTLKRKYGSNIREILEFCEKSSKRLQELEAREERGGNLDAEILSSEKRMMELGGKLGKARASGGKKLAEAISGQLRELGFRQSGFSIRLDALEAPGPGGLETAEFLFSPNPGEPELPLRQIASSGEISRVMLALKCALAAQDPIALLVFDEIDANVGGETATKVGKKMAQLGASRQVLCITHLPQVAAAASAHFVVEKQVRSGRTESLLRKVQAGEREKEIARMLGGESESALDHARTLLKTAHAK